MINMILATTANGGMGLNNIIPWYYPQDFKVFRALTMKQKIIMGKNTWESLPKKPLKDRLNIVLTKQSTLFQYPNHPFEDTFFCDSVSNTLSQLRSLNESNVDVVSNPMDWGSIWVIGGASIYRQFVDLCSYVQHTLVRKDYECDTFFNPTKEMDLELVSEVDTGADSEIVFRLYHRRNSIFKKNKEFEEKTTRLIRSTLGVS